MIIIFLTYYLIIIYERQTKLVMNLVYFVDNDALLDALKKFKYVKKFINLLKNPIVILNKLKKLINKSKANLTGNDKFRNKINYKRRKMM